MIGLVKSLTKPRILEHKDIQLSPLPWPDVACAWVYSSLLLPSDLSHSEDNIHKTIYTRRISGRFGIFRRSRDQFKMATSMNEQQTNMMSYEENELVSITPEDEQEAVNSLDNLVLSSDDEYFVDLDSSFNEKETTESCMTADDTDTDSDRPMTMSITKSLCTDTDSSNTVTDTVTVSVTATVTDHDDHIATTSTRPTNTMPTVDTTTRTRPTATPARFKCECCGKMYKREIFWQKHSLTCNIGKSKKRKNLSTPQATSRSTTVTGK